MEEPSDEGDGAIKKRLDIIVIELGLLPSRQAAQAAIMDGGILVDGQKVTKPGTAIKPDARIELLPGWGSSKYVSRGGLKLEKALSEFGINPSGRVCLDIGSSTGGFTDCLLKHGASLVYAVDVGYGQLDWSLRNDPRVVVKERMNARFLSPDSLYGAGGSRANLAVADVSFISLIKVLPACISVLEGPEAEIVSLIKPQFEAGRQYVGKGGVVRAKETHCRVIESVFAQASDLGLAAYGLTWSPVKGPAGNIEFLVYWKKAEASATPDIESIVQEAHERLHDDTPD